MADFVQSANVKSATRTLAEPIAVLGRAGHARSCSLVLADAPARFTSPRCFSSVDCWDDDPPGLSQAPAPAADPARSSHTAKAECSSLLKKKVRLSCHEIGKIVNCRKMIRTR